MDSSEAFVTIDEAADILKTNRRHIKRMVAAGLLRAKDIGLGEERSHLRIVKEDVLAIPPKRKRKKKTEN